MHISTKKRETITNTHNKCNTSVIRLPATDSLRVRENEEREQKRWRTHGERRNKNTQTKNNSFCVFFSRSFTWNANTQREIISIFSSFKHMCLITALFVFLLFFYTLHNSILRGTEIIFNMLLYFSA